MKLVVGLGNPGKRYDGTRHNVGFMVAAELARRHATGRPRTAFHGEMLDADLGGMRTLLLCPHTLMNRSGQSVSAAAAFYQVPPSDLLVVCDDFNLPLGKLRLRREGSAGGQKGLEDIIKRLGTEEFNRLRIGIGPVPDNWDAADFVLSKFGPSDRTIIEDSIATAAEAVECWVTQGIEPSMSKYN